MLHPTDPTSRDAWEGVESEAIERMVVVGGGPAAHRCVTELRKLGFSGSVSLVSAEEIPPYDRTLLSKDNLTASSPELARMAPLSTYRNLDVDLLLGREAIALDPASRTLELSDGDRLGFDRLVLAVGGTPILPRALAAPGALTMRTFDDVALIRDALERSRHVVVIGAGFIGGEIAAAATEFGAAVTLVEACQTPLEGALGAEVGQRVADLHKKHSVSLRCGAHVSSVAEIGGSHTIELSDGSTLTADSVIVGVGMRPSIDWLASTGIETERALVTDSQCRTSLPGIFAAGDCAQWWSPRYNTYCHIEHWDNAGKHGAATARAVLGQPTAFDPVPFFWSDQYDVKYQWAGYAPASDAVEIDGTGPEDFSARYLNRGRLVGVFVANRPKEFGRLRRELMDASKPGQNDKEGVLR